MVLVQGTAEIDDRDLDANRERYQRESLEKLPALKSVTPPRAVRRMLNWYYTRIYVHVRPERVYVWPNADGPLPEPQLFGAHLEEVRSGHSEEPERFHADPEGGLDAWHPRLGELGTTYKTAVISIVSPNGFPFAVRVPVSAHQGTRRIRLEGELTGMPLQPGLACLTAHVHAEEFKWQQNFQVRGDLVFAQDHWEVIPHRIVGGFEIPKSPVAALRQNLNKARRFRRVAKRELARRG